MTESLESAQGTGASGRSQWPAVRAITLGDLLEVFAAGLSDFRRAPLYGLALGAIYALGGWLLVLLLLYADLPFLVYPLAAGFALVAPFVATGFYAVSFCLERGEPVSWSAVRRLVGQAARRDLGWMALVTGFSFFIWMDIAALLFFGFLGFSALSAESLVTEVFTTPAGLLFLLVGNAVGAVIALAVFSFSVTSFPMLFERDCDFVTAMVTSVRVVLASPRVMVVWCALIAGLIGISLLSGFVGLLVVLPVLGHASWHLYRRCVPAAEESGAEG
jgi:uncharacterized membrane protein